MSRGAVLGGREEAGGDDQGPLPPPEALRSLPPSAGRGRELHLLRWGWNAV